MSRSRPQRRGFTLVEAIVVSGLMAVLALVISSAWAGLGRPAVDGMTRCRVAQEMRLAVAALARDLGGGLAGDAGRQDIKQRGELVGWLHPNETQLWLCYDSGPQPNGTPDWSGLDSIIVYSLDAGRLVRWDRTAETTFTVARDVQSVSFHSVGDRLAIDLTFHYRDLTRTYQFVTRLP